MNNDLISREALKNDISEKLCDKFDKWNKTITVSEFEAVVIDVIDNAPTVSIPTPTEDDLISRSALINQIDTTDWSDVRLLVEDAPTVEPERPKGTWSPCYENPRNGKYYKDCSNCGEPTLTGYNNFCLNCGADMRGGAE